MEYDPGTWDMFADIATINAWLDRSNAHMNGEHDDSMRVMKIGEELGEAVAAYIGFTGQNPRKGQTHTQAELLAELADVAVTALAAIQHFTQDPAVTRAVMAGKVTGIMRRAGLFRDVPDADAPALIDASEVPFATVPRLRRIGETEDQEDTTAVLARNPVRKPE